MLRLCLSVLRFCLSAWVGIAIFFFVLVIKLRNWGLPFSLEIKDEHPKVLFPVYYAFESALLAPAFLCAGAGLWNRTLGRGRRLAILQLLVIAAALAVWDFTMIYQKLAEMMKLGRPYPTMFQSLHQMSRWLNVTIVCTCATALMLALIPEHPHGATPSSKD